MRNVFGSWICDLCIFYFIAHKCMRMYPTSWRTNTKSQVTVQCCIIFIWYNTFAFIRTAGNDDWKYSIYDWVKSWRLELHCFRILFWGVWPSFPNCRQLNISYAAKCWNERPRTYSIIIDTFQMPKLIDLCIPNSFVC